MTGTLFGEIGSRGTWTVCWTGIAAAAAFGLALDKAVAAADKSGEGLGSPRGAPPQGERWYYRVERAGKRHCWYTRADAGSPRKSVAQPPIAAKAEAAPPPLLPSVADARAEAEQGPPPQKAASEATRELPKAAETGNRILTMAERWPDRAEPVQAATPPPVRLMQVRTVPAEPPAEAGESVLEKLFEIGGGAAAMSGMFLLLIAVLRRRRSHDEDDTDLPALIAPDGRPSATWYEPPMDRLRMARHLADLPRPAS